MTSLAKVAVAAAAAVVVAVVGFGLVRPSGPGGSTSASPNLPPTHLPSPSLAPSVASSSTLRPVACEDGLPCLGALVAGRHTSGTFEPKIFYQTPDGWANVIDVEKIFKLDPSTPGDPYILLWFDARIAEQTPTCAPSADLTRGTTAADWISFIQGHPGLVSSTPVSLPLSLGTATAQAIDIAVSPEWTATCPIHGDVPYVTLLTEGTGEYGLARDGRLHLVAFDLVRMGCSPQPSVAYLGNGCRRGTVVSLTYGSPGSSEEQFLADTAAAREVIGTFEFGCGPAYNRGPCGGGPR